MQLIARNITKKFGATQALDNISVTIESGKVHALVGENGAGKSTLFKVLAGYEKPDAGIITSDGQVYEPLNVNQAQELGVAMVLQELSINTSLGIAENVFIGKLRDFNNRIGFLNKKELWRSAQEILDLTGSGIFTSQDLRNLDFGQWKIIEIARALSYEPKIIFLDESTAYLNTQEVNAFLKVINTLREKGIAIGFVSHHIDEVSKIADIITILKDGKMVGSYEVGEINTEEIEALMVGREIGRDIYPYQGHPEVKGVWCANGGTASGVRTAIKNMGKDPGKDIKIATMDLNPDNIEAMKRGELVFDIGGHWMQGGFALTALFDYLNGFPISPDQAVVKLNLTPLTPDRINEYEEDFPNNWPSYDFKKHSRVFNPSMVSSFSDLVKTTANHLSRSHRKFTIGAVVPTLDAIFWNRYFEFMQNAANVLGIELIRLNADNRPELNEKHINSLVNKKVDGIIFVPYWDSDLKCLSLTKAAGIPVIFTDTYSNREQPQSNEFPNYIAFFGPADEEAGYQMGNHLIDALSPDANGKKYIGAVEGTPGTTVAIDRMKGLIRSLAEHPEVVLVGKVNGNFVPYQSQIAFESTGWSARKPGQAILVLDEINVMGKLEDIDLTLYRGEILGIGGLKGSGGEAILETIIGEHHPSKGNMRYCGSPFHPANPSGAWEKGIGYLPGSRSSEGLIVNFSVFENLIMADIPHRGPFFNNAKAVNMAESQISNLHIKTLNPYVPCSSLSGGNMQKVVLGKCIAANPKVLLLNNPTRGIDVGSRIEIYRIINDLTKDGVSVILLSEDLPELIGLCDRIIISRQRTISKEFSRENWPTEDEIITYMI